MLEEKESVIIMVLKVGINKKGINGDVHTYVYDAKYSFSDIEKMKKIANNFVQNIPLEYQEIEIYNYDINSIAKLEFMEVVKAFINSKTERKVYHMVYDNDTDGYIRHRIK